MKLLKIAILVAILAFCTCPDTDKTIEKISQAGKEKQTHVEELFNVETHYQECKAETDDRKRLAEYGDAGPKTKSNPWKKFGMGEAAFFYDHLDFLLQKKMVAKFKAIYKAAKEVPIENVPDIYSEEVLKLTVVQGRDFSQGFKPYLRDFDQKAYEMGVRYPQVVQFIAKARWHREHVLNFEKISFDKFDFNGDGRLDISEFILFSIVHNIPSYAKAECVEEFCFDDFFKNYIDPMFNFADCQKNGYVTAEDIWNSVKKLKRPTTEKYSMYTCSIKLDYTKDYRTISVSDFVLISDWDHNGYLTDNEFRAGILMGYWKRQTTQTAVMEGDELNYKKERWNADGTMDLMCGQIKDFLPGTPKNNEKNKSPVAMPEPAAQNNKKSTGILDGFFD